MNLEIQLATTPDQIARCFPVMRQLRPDLDEGTFVARVNEQQKSQNYHLAVALLDEQPVAVAGYRYMNNLHMGFHLYVDDLVTDERERGKGYGQALMGWLENEARTAGCSSLHLDSGTHRHAAHRLYIRSGMDIVYYHFRKMLS